jgi:hypothetical protein
MLMCTERLSGELTNAYSNFKAPTRAIRRALEAYASQAASTKNALRNRRIEACQRRSYARRMPQ